MAKSEQTAREQIDLLLTQAGWSVCAVVEANLCAHRSVATQKFPLKQRCGFADYMLYVDGRAAANDSAESSKLAEAAPEYASRGTTFLDRMQKMPPLEKEKLRPARIRATGN